MKAREMKKEMLKAAESRFLMWPKKKRKAMAKTFVERHIAVIRSEVKEGLHG